MSEIFDAYLMYCHYLGWKKNTKDSMKHLTAVTTVAAKGIAALTVNANIPLVYRRMEIIYGSVIKIKLKPNTMLLCIYIYIYITTTNPSF